MRDSKIYDILSAKAASGVDKHAFAQDFRNAIFNLDSDNSANLTVKFVASIAEDRPDFTSAQSPTNQWDYVQVIDLEDGTSIDGDTGIVLSGTDDNRQLEANINGIRWISAIVSGYSAGDVTVKARLFTNE